MAYSKEFRREVLAACDAGGGTRNVATHFQVAESRMRRIKQERREQGETAPSTTRRRTTKWRALEPQIRQALAEQPDLTLKELRAHLKTELCVQTLCSALRILKLTLKKVLMAAEQDRPDVAQRRAEGGGGPRRGAPPRPGAPA